MLFFRFPLSSTHSCLSTNLENGIFISSGYIGKSQKNLDFPYNLGGGAVEQLSRARNTEEQKA